MSPHTIRKPMNEAKIAIIEAMDLEQHFGHEHLTHRLTTVLAEQLLACRDPEARRLLLGISEKGDPGPVPEMKMRKRKPRPNRASGRR